jgi:hypothetical protein
LAIIFSKGIQISIPFDWEQVLFFIVARLTGRHNISLFGFAPPHQGHNVVHSKLGRREVLSAVVTATFGELTLPPLGVPQLPSFSFFDLNGPVLCFNAKGIHAGLVLCSDSTAEKNHPKGYAKDSVERLVKIKV